MEAFTDQMFGLLASFWELFRALQGKAASKITGAVLGCLTQKSKKR